MEELVLVLTFASWHTLAMAMEPELPAYNDTEVSANGTNKDMYVIHAMMYQVGIVTNKTDNETTNAGGNQEAVTFFHSNGSGGLDLSNIPAPLLTNVTAHSMMGVAPITNTAENTPNKLSWNTLNHFTNISPSTVSTETKQPMGTSRRSIRSIDIIDSDSHKPLNKFYRSLFKRDLGSSSVKIHGGSAVIPQAAGVQSIAIPPLLSFNTNLSDIPVPIPNTSVVHYAKMNTLVSKP